MRPPRFSFLFSLLLAGTAFADSLHVRLVGHYADSLELGGGYSGDVCGDYAYYLGHNKDFTVLSIADPAHPVLVGSSDWDETVASVTAVADFVYVASDRLHIFSVADPSYPVEVGSSTGILATPRGLAVSGGYAYAACDSQGLRIISVADPTHPEDVASYDMPGLAYEVEVVGDYAYVANLFDGLRILSVTDPVHPVEVGYMPGSPGTMSVDGDYAYVYDVFSGAFEVISIADPAHPVEVGRLAGVGGEVEVAGSYAYVLHVNQAMLYVVSIADPTHPVEVGHYALDPQFWALDAGRGYAYAGSNDGYWILEFYLPGDLDVDNDSLDVTRDTMDLHTQPAGPVYSPYAKARFMLVNSSDSYNPDTADGPSRSPLREVKVEAKVEAQGRSIDSVYVLNLPESLAVGQAIECTLALVLPVGTTPDGYAGWVTISAYDTLGYQVRDSFAIAVRGPLPRQNLDSLRVAPIPFKPHQNPEHDAIHFQGLTEGARVTVYDASGQEVWRDIEKGDGHVEWDAKVASGIYMYLVVAKDGESRVGKLSVIR